MTHTVESRSAGRLSLDSDVCVSFHTIENEHFKEESTTQLKWADGAVMQTVYVVGRYIVCSIQDKLQHPQCKLEYMFSVDDLDRSNLTVCKIYCKTRNRDYAANVRTEGIM